MGLLDGLLGNASEVDVGSVEEALATSLIDGEAVLHAYRLLRDMIVVTPHRLIFIDKQGLAGRKQQIDSIPFASIVRFSKENKGRLDRDAELKLWVRGESTPIEYQFRGNKSEDDIYRVVAERVLR